MVHDAQVSSWERFLLTPRFRWARSLICWDTLSLRRFTERFGAGTARRRLSDHISFVIGYIGGFSEICQR